MIVRKQIILVALALLVLTLAVMLQWQARYRHEPEDYGRLFPNLTSVLNDINRVELISSTESTFLQLEDGEWIVEQKGGYPADIGRIRALLLQLSESEILEPKTSNPDRYHLIGIQDPAEQPGAGGTILRCFTGNEIEQAAVIVGAPSEQVDGSFVRRYGEAQSWLVSGDLNLTADPSNWIDSHLLSVQAERLASIEIKPVKGRAYRLTRDTDATEWRIASPATKQAPDSGMLHRIAGTVMNLKAVDVLDQITEEDWRKAVFITHDGLIVELSLKHNEGDYLVRLSSAVDPDVVTQQDNADDIRATSESINRKAAERVYQIPPYEGRILFNNYKDLLKARAVDN